MSVHMYAQGSTRPLEALCELLWVLRDKPCFEALHLLLVSTGNLQHWTGQLKIDRGFRRAPGAASNVYPEQIMQLSLSVLTACCKVLACLCTHTCSYSIATRETQHFPAALNDV